MKKNFRKSGRKIIRKISRTSQKTSEQSKEHIKRNLIARVGNVRSVRLWVLEWILLVTVIILFAVVQNIWYRNTTESEVFVAGGTYTEGTIGDVNSLNPLYAATSSERVLARLMFANLLAPDTAGRIGNQLAQSVRVDKSGRIWTLRLKDNLHWSDGEAITTEDVAYTIDLMQDANAKTVTVANFANVEVKRVDDLTMSFELPTVYAAFPETLNFPVLPEHILGSVDAGLVYEHDFSDNPVSSGAFKFNAIQPNSRGQTIHLIQNANYYAGEPMLEYFVVRTYEDESAVREALIGAEITATAELAADTEMGVQAIYERQTALNGGIFAFLNTQSATLQTKAVRQAIQRGVNIAAVREVVSEYPALDLPIIARQMPELQLPELRGYDLAAAKKLLTGAKYSYRGEELYRPDGERAELSVAVQDGDVLTTVAERWAEQLTTLGFQVNLNKFDQAAVGQDFFTAVVSARAYDVLIYEVDLGLDPDPFPYYSSTAVRDGLNLSNYESLIVDDLLLSARTTTDRGLRAAKYNTFLEQWVSDVPAIGVAQSSLTYYYARNSRIYSENSVLAGALDRFADVIYWANTRAARNLTP